MTISQALRRIAKLKGAFKERLERAAASNCFFDDAPPAWSFAATLEEADIGREELIRLESMLRITNASTLIEWAGRKITLSEATCRLQEMKSRIVWLKALTVHPQTKGQQVSVVRAVDGNYLNQARITTCVLAEENRAKAVAAEQEAFDALNDLVETANHRTDLQRTV